MEKKHICPICSRAFKRSDNLKAHARTVHYGVKANNCNACGKGYRTKNELLRHQTKTCLYREMIRSQEESGQTDDDFNLDFDESLLIWWITMLTEMNIELLLDFIRNFGLGVNLTNFVFTEL